MRRKVNTTMDEELHRAAKQYADRTGRTLSGLIEVALKQRLPDEELNN